MKTLLSLSSTTSTRVLARHGCRGDATLQRLVVCSMLLLLIATTTTSAFSLNLFGSSIRPTVLLDTQNTPSRRTIPTPQPPYNPQARRRVGVVLSAQTEDAQEEEEALEQVEAAVLQAEDATTALLVEEMTTSEMDLGEVTPPAPVDELNGEDADNGKRNTKMALTEAPPISFQKFLTMQGKRVIVTIRYSGEAGLKPYFLTAAKKIKASHPDVILERRQLADMDKEDPTAEPSFEILVDGKVVVGNNKSRSRKKIGNVDLSWSRSMFVSMQELDLAISRARRRRRPSTTVYGEVHEPSDVQTPLRLDGLRQGSSTSVVKKKHHEWND